MPEQVDTIVIGAGQAGLSASYYLTQHGREHLVLEQGEIAHTWRTKRWDGFYLNTPNWAQRLPGHEYRGPEPDAFAPLAEVVAYLEEYASSIPAPVRTGHHVTALRREQDGYRVETDADELRAANVIVATGAYDGRRRRSSPRQLPRACSSSTRATTGTPSNSRPAQC